MMRSQSKVVFVMSLAKPLGGVANATLGPFSNTASPRTAKDARRPTLIRRVDLIPVGLIQVDEEGLDGTGIWVFMVILPPWVADVVCAAFGDSSACWPLISRSMRRRAVASCKARHRHICSGLPLYARLVQAGSGRDRSRGGPPKYAAARKWVAPGAATLMTRGGA